MIKLKVKDKNTFFSKSIGLIGKTQPENIYFQTRFGIHTFGMNYPMDIIILDSNNKVRTLKKSLKPNRIFVWNPSYNNVIELKEHTIRIMKIKINDSIDLLVEH